MAPKSKIRTVATSKPLARPRASNQKKATVASLSTAALTTSKSKTPHLTHQSATVSVQTKRNRTQNVPADEQIEAKDATCYDHASQLEFTLFSKLPLELRLRIWAAAEPDPCIVRERPSPSMFRRFTYARPVPSILHACRESRQEYLETEEPNDRTLARRRRAHAVYKLSFTDARSRGPKVFFSSDIDVFWGLRYDGRKCRGGRRRVRMIFSGIAELDIATTLKHLIIPSTGLSPEPRVEFLRESFPKLETLTVLFDFSQFPALNRTVEFPEEVNGEMNLTGVGGLHRTLTEGERQWYRNNYARVAKEHEDWVPPKLVCRLEVQFRKNEGIEDDPPKVDPLAYLDQE